MLTTTTSKIRASIPLELHSPATYKVEQILESKPSVVKLKESIVKHRSFRRPFSQALFVALLLAILALRSVAETNKVFSLRGNFRDYLILSRNLTDAEKLRLWYALVERPNTELYASYVAADPKQKEMRDQYVLSWLAYYDVMGSQILERFAQLEPYSEHAVERFRRNFPSFDGDLVIYLLPAMNFNGRTSRVRERPALLIGVDVFVRNGDDPDVLFTHELFHLYHDQIHSKYESEQNKGTKLTWPLFKEGLATFVSYRDNPHKGEAIFLDPQLSRLEDCQAILLSEKFLEVAELTREDPGSGSQYRLWFSASPPRQLYPGYPPRLGYWLGFQVVQYLSRSYSVETMAAWTRAEAHKHVMQALTAMSTQVGSKFIPKAVENENSDDPL